MKTAIISLLLLTNLFGLEKGDVIGKNIASHIGCTEKNKVYVIDFFASWCGSCKKEIPLLSKANTKIDKSKAEIIGIDVDKKVNQGIEFQKALKNKGQLNFKVINDPQNLIIAEFAPIGMPTLYYVKNRKIIDIITGAVDNIDTKILHDLKGIK